jgi:hypothetical protein
MCGEDDACQVLLIWTSAGWCASGWWCAAGAQTYLGARIGDGSGHKRIDGGALQAGAGCGRSIY